MNKILITLLISVSSYSQVSFYFPLGTHHFARDYAWRYADNEGGDKGLIISYERKHLIASVGFIRNSFGDSSRLFTVGLKKDYNKFDMSISTGLSDGYERFYYFYPDEKYPKFFKDNNILPIALITTRVKVYKNMGIQVNISPAYINYGIFIKI